MSSDRDSAAGSALSSADSRTRGGAPGSACRVGSACEADPNREPPQRLRCRHCHDVIGAYEPMVLETRKGRGETSLAAHTWLYETDQPCFHRACYNAARGLGP
jgi:hypothetical protein